MELLAIALPGGISILLALATARWLRRRKPAWSAGRVALLAAAPLPSIGAAFGAGLFVHIEASLPPEACGMPLLGAMMLILYSIAGYVVASTACRAYLGAPAR